MFVGGLLRIVDYVEVSLRYPRLSGCWGDVAWGGGESGRGREKMLEVGFSYVCIMVREAC